jgi:hypothetical protein
MASKYIQEKKSSPSWQLPAIVILALIALGSLGLAWSNLAKLDATKQSVADQVKATQQSMQQDMTTLKDRLAADEKLNTDLQGDLKVVTDKLEVTQGQLKKARQQATASDSQTAETAEMVKNFDTSVQSDLATKATTDDVKDLDDKVTKATSDLEKTKNDLNMARSELGTLIARNHDEIDELRRQGEPNGLVPGVELTKHTFSEPVWNAWTESSSAHPMFQPERPVPNKHYSVIINLAALAYNVDAAYKNIGVFSQETKPNSMFADWLEKNKDKKSREIEVIILPDPLHFEAQAPNEVVKHMSIDLDQMRKVKASGFTVPEPPLKYLRDNDGNAAFSFGIKSFEIVPTQPGLGWISFSIWADGLPVTEFNYPACILSDQVKKCDLPSIAPVSLEGVDLSKLTLPPDGALQVIDRERDVVGVFRCNTCNWSSDDYRAWIVAVSTEQFASGIRRILKRLGSMAMPTSATMAQYNAELHNASEALYNDLFGTSSLGANGAKTALADFLIKARTSVASGGPTLSFFVRMIPSKPELVLTPLGLLEIRQPIGATPSAWQPGPYPDFAGFYVDVQIPLRLQDYSTSSACLSKWVLMVPPDPLENATDGSTDYDAVRTARQEIRSWIDEFQSKCGDCVKSDLQMQNFEEWLQGTGQAADIVLTLSHHDDDFGLFFDVINKHPAILSDDIKRNFDYPAVAILAACGTAEPGGADFVEKLNNNHIRTIIATSNSVEPTLAGRFLNTFLQCLKDQTSGSSYSIGQAWLDSIRKLSTALDQNNIPFGPRALEFVLIGNGSLRLCSLKDLATTNTRN